MGNVGSGLARVVVAAPKRRLDVAIPDYLPLSVVLPDILARAGDGLADEGMANGGWVLRRTDGSPIEAGRTAAAQGIRDGEVLHLAHARTDWPEIAYDDVVDLVAASARTGSRVWGPAETRMCGL